ncbi:MAG: S41 family peptidase [Phocaeicola sp.]
MKSIKYTILLITLLTLFSACGEDRTNEYNLLIADKVYMEETMKNHYLFYDQMNVPSEKDYFNTPKIFFPKLLFKGSSTQAPDRYSYLEEKESNTRSYINQKSTYGFEFELITDPTQITRRIYARVLFVLPNSPASEAGLSRGDWIASVEDKTLTANNYNLLISGKETSFTRVELKQDEGAWVWESRDQINISYSRPVALDPFYLDTTYVVNNQKIAYMVYNQFSISPQNGASNTDYVTRMKEIFAHFKQKAPDAFILDLRYNPGGYISMAIELASLLAPNSALGETFVELKYNDKTTPQIVPLKLHEEVPENLNLSKIYILTTSFTASASELIIHCLKPYLGTENVILLGDRTEGKNMAMAPFTKADVNFTMWPLVAYISDVNGNSNYSKGIEPNFFLPENKQYQKLLPLGNTDEFLLKNAISHITTGAIINSQPIQSTSRTLYNSLERERIPAARISTP